MRVGSTKSPSGPQFWQRGIDKRLDYERETFFAVVTAVWSDTTYDVAVGSGLSECAQFYDVGNGTPYLYSVGDRVIVGRVSGGRGNRHVILSPAGWSGVVTPSGGGGGGGSTPSGSESLSEVIDARSSDVYGDFAFLDGRLEAGDAEVEAARSSAVYGDLSTLDERIEQVDDEVYTARSSQVYGDFDTLDERLEEGDWEVALARHGEANLSEYLDTLSGGGAATFLGLTDTPASYAGQSGLFPKVKATEDGLEFGEAGGGALSDTDPKEPRAPPQAGTAATGSRADHQHPDPQWLCEQMLDKVLCNSLDTKSAVKAQVTYQFGNAATDNNGVATWSGTWTSAAGYRQTTVAASYFEFVFVGDGVDLTIPATVAGYSGTVLLDGDAHGTWNQATATTYSITGLGYWAHVVRVTKAGSGTRIGQAKPNQLPYQGLGVSGDQIEALYMQPWLHLCTIGTATTNNSGVYPSSSFGETMLPRLPLSTNYGSDRVLLRDKLNTQVAPTDRGYVRIPVEFSNTYVVSGVAYDLGRFPLAGITLTLGSGGATRGCRPTTPFTMHWVLGRALTTAVIHCSFLVFIGRVTAVGAGSSLSVGEIVLGIAWYGSTSASAENVAGIADGADCAADLYKIPGSLL